MTIVFYKLKLDGEIAFYAFHSQAKYAIVLKFIQ